MSTKGDRRGEIASSPVVARRAVLSVRGDRWEFVADTVVREVHLALSAGGEPLATLACSPQDLGDLVHGFLFTHGVIRTADDVAGLTFEGAGNEDEAVRATSGENPSITLAVEFADRATARMAQEQLREVRFVPSGCGQAPQAGMPTAEPAPGSALAPGAVPALARLIQTLSPVFLATGGVHAAALVDLASLAEPDPANLTPIVVREDIGRHNAVDKAIGFCLRNGVDQRSTALVVTGRLSADLVHKAQAGGIPVLVSRSAPTDVAIELAEAAGIALIGFARHDRFNVYANWWRLRLAKDR